MTQSEGNLLIIGARSLIGRRMAEAIAAAGWSEKNVRYTSRQALAGEGRVLDTTRPDDFKPDMTFASVIICAPVWLVTEALLVRLNALGMRRLVVFSSTSRLTKNESELKPSVKSWASSPWARQPSLKSVLRWALITRYCARP